MTKFLIKIHHAHPLELCQERLRLFPLLKKRKKSGHASVLKYCKVVKFYWFFKKLQILYADLRNSCRQIQN